MAEGVVLYVLKWLKVKAVRERGANFHEEHH